VDVFFCLAVVVVNAKGKKKEDQDKNKNTGKMEPGRIKEDVVRGGPSKTDTGKVSLHAKKSKHDEKVKNLARELNRAPKSNSSSSSSGS